MHDKQELFSCWAKLMGLFKERLDVLHGGGNWPGPDFERSVQRVRGACIRAGRDFHNLVTTTCLLPEPQGRWTTLLQQPVGEWRVDGDFANRVFWEVYWVLAIRWLYDMPNTGVILADDSLIYANPPEGWGQDSYYLDRNDHPTMDQVFEHPSGSDRPFILDVTEASVAGCAFICEKILQAPNCDFVDTWQKRKDQPDYDPDEVIPSLVHEYAMALARIEVEAGDAAQQSQEAAPPAIAADNAIQNAETSDQSEAGKPIPPTPVAFPNPSAPLTLNRIAEAWGGDMTRKKLRGLIDSGRIRAQQMNRQTFIVCLDDIPNPTVQNKLAPPGQRSP